MYANIIGSINHVAGTAGQVSFSAMIQNPGEQKVTNLTFVGSVYGSPGPIVMFIDGRDFGFVTEPGRFGTQFNESWLRSFVDH